MESNRGYKYRIYRNDAQRKAIASTLGCCRFIYNHFLSVRKEAWTDRKVNITYTKTSSMLTALKRDPDHLWLAGVDSMALQESLRNLDRAYKNFFEKRAGCPKFKAKRDSRQSYRTRNNKKDNIRIEGDRIRLPRLGLVKARITRLPKGSIQNATVSRTSTGKYYVSLCCREEIEPKPNKGGEIGIDLGIRDLFVGSDGSMTGYAYGIERKEYLLALESKSPAAPLSQPHGSTVVRWLS